MLADISLPVLSFSPTAGAITREPSTAAEISILTGQFQPIDISPNQNFYASQPAGQQGLGIH